MCMTVTAQTAFAEQMQVVFYGKTTAYKQISVLALDKDLPGSEIKEQNIKYINQVSSDADGNYSMIFPFDADGSGYVFRSNETGMFRIEGEGQTLYVSESGSDLNDGSEGSPFQTLNRAFSMAVSGGSVGRSTNVKIKGGKVMNVFAGSASSAPTLNCDTNITMTGGTAEALFGGSEGTNLTGNAHLYLLGEGLNSTNVWVKASTVRLLKYSARESMRVRAHTRCTL